MTILTISGSARINSANTKLLKAIPPFYPTHKFHHYPIENLPLFHADLQDQKDPAIVIEFKNKIAEADAVIISTPAYIYNLPATLKNALEWTTKSGEFYEKKVLAITFTPTAPRGPKAMQSLLWSLQALKANVVVQLPLYQDEVLFDEEGKLLNGPSLEILQEAIALLG